MKPNKGERGAALVELAIILPLLGLLLMGIIDFGLMQREHQVLQNAVREGARVSMLPNYHAGTALPVNGESQSQASIRVAESVRDVVLAYLANENVTIAKADCMDNNGDMSSFTCGEVSVDQGYAMTLSDGTLIGGSRVSVTTTRPALLGFYGPFKLSGVSVFRNLY